MHYAVIHLSVFTSEQQWNTAAALLTDITRKPIHMKHNYKYNNKSAQKYQVV